MLFFYSVVSGDECLRRTATALKSVFSRQVDLVARYGGEEFVILLPATDAAEMTRMGEKLRRAVASLQMAHSGNAEYGIVTISLGAHALVPQPGTRQEAFIECADRALYQAKRQGRNCLVSAL